MLDFRKFTYKNHQGINMLLSSKTVEGMNGKETASIRESEYLHTVM